jgi:K+-transporting ATPase KdpF subunit
VGHGTRLRAPAAQEGCVVSGWTLAAALLAAGLLVYLVAVLLRPEDFS